MSGRRRGRPAGKLKKPWRAEQNEKQGTEGSSTSLTNRRHTDNQISDRRGDAPADHSKNGKERDEVQRRMLEYYDIEGEVETTEDEQEDELEVMEQEMNSKVNSEIRGKAESPKWSDIVEKEEKGDTEPAITSSRKSWAQVVQGEEGLIPFMQPTSVEGIKMGELMPEEVKEAKLYWENVLVCKVVGSFPPFPVMNGFLNRIWRSKGIQKVWQIDRGVFMARFNLKEEMEEACNRGVIHFDGKPLLVMPWNEELNFDEMKLPALPVWVQLPKLELKYWTPSIIGKIVSSIGRPIKVDTATMNKERLQFARVLVEVNIKEELEDHTVFKNELGQIMHQKIIYEWKPLKCKTCKGFGHQTLECRKGVTRKIYVPKPAPITQTSGNTEENRMAGKHVNKLEEETSERAETPTPNSNHQEQPENLKDKESLMHSQPQDLYMVVQRRKHKGKEQCKYEDQGVESGSKTKGREDKPPDDHGI